MEKFILRSPYWLKVILVNIYGFFLFRRRFLGSFSKWLAIYNSNLNMGADEIETEQFHLLKNNLVYCFENIPYYRELFEKIGFNPNNMQSIGELEKVPFLTKDLIRENFDKLYNRNISRNRYVLHTTSGSTGEKLKFLLPKELFYKINSAFTYRFYGLFGVRQGDRRVTIGGRVFTRKFPYWVFNIFENQLLLSAHHLNINTADLYLNRIEKFKPVFIQGHPSAILILSKYALEREGGLKLNLKAIFTTGETLLKDDQQLIQKAFNCPVAQQYGSGENCFSAQQAPDSEGYLINFEHGFIELIDGSDDNVKEVVVTSFLNDVMPFVRYRIGDFVISTPKHYSEKYNLPILFNEVLGRVDDILYDFNKNPVLPVTIRMNIKPLLGYNTNYQLIQKTILEFELKLVDRDRVIFVAKIVDVLERIFGSNIKVEVIYIDTLTSKNGKIRNIICKLGK